MVEIGDNNNKDGNGDDEEEEEIEEEEGDNEGRRRRRSVEGRVTNAPLVKNCLCFSSGKRKIPHYIINPYCALGASNLARFISSDACLLLLSSESVARFLCTAFVSRGGPS